MRDVPERELSTQEYVILGLISTGPQSGYSIISTLEVGVYRWSASPGSIYPILKRLERDGIIAGELEMVHETRPRKVYSLTPFGETILDTWIKARLTLRELYQERDTVMLKFMFAEYRLTRDEILAWLDQYEQDTETFTVTRLPFNTRLAKQASIHVQLLLEEVTMELQMQKNWIQLARQRFTESDQR